MANIQRNFIAGRMNKSLDERLVPNGEYIDAMNVRLGSTEDSEIGSVENSKGNTALTALQYLDGTLLSSSAKCIGAFEDGSRDTIYWFMHDSSFSVGATGKLDMIVSYNTKTLTLTYHIISIDNGLGVDTYLNFNSDYLITGVDMIGDLLFFTDNYNPPRFINIKKNYKDPISDLDQFNPESILVIKKPPITSPSIMPITTGGQDDFLDTRFVCFAYRYQYENGEYSAISQFSEPSFIPKTFNFSYDSYLNEGMTNLANSTIITFNSGGPLVVGVDLLFKESQDSVIKVIEKLNKSDLGYANDTEYTYTFTNSKIFTVLPDTEILRLYDNVPKLAQAQTLMGNRLVYGNYVEGNNLTDKNGNPVKFEYVTSLVTELIDQQDLSDRTALGNYTIDTPQAIANSVVYFDLDGMELTQGAAITLEVRLTHDSFSGDAPFPSETTSQINSTFTYYLPSDFSSVYALATSSDFQEKVGTALNINPVYDATPGNPTSCDGFTFTDQVNCALPLNLDTLEKFESGISGGAQPIEIITSPGSTEIGFQFTAMRYVDDVSSPSQNVYEYYEVIYSEAFYQKVSNSKSLHSNRGYEIGIVYMDEFNRATTSLVSLNNTVEIPCAYSSNKNSINVTIPSTQIAPSWATRYKFVIKPDEENYETIYSSIFFQDPLTNAAYFNLEGENASKVQEGDRLIVKRDTSSATQNCVYATVLEKEAKEANFLEIPREDDPTEFIPVPAGIYMKINPNNFSVVQIENAIVALGLKKKIEDDAGDYPILAYPMGLPSTGVNAYEDYTVPAGSRIVFRIKQSRLGPGAGNGGCERRIYELGELTLVASQDYDNMYEWFIGDNVESILNSGTQEVGGSANDITNVFIPTLATGPNDITLEQDTNYYRFYRDADNLLSLLISGTERCGGVLSKDKRRSTVEAQFTVYRAENTLIFETEPANALPDVWYENNLSFAIDENGNHLGNLQDQDISLSTPAIIDTEFFNCFSFGNGAESYKIRDSVSGQTFNLGNRVTTTSAQDYKEAHRFADLTYSGVFNDESNVNKLNEFNLGLLNFKPLEDSFGSIQKLYARETDILTLQEDKISYVLSGKNLLSDSSGGGSLTSVPEVLGTQIARLENYGISSNPESFASRGSDMYFTDAKRGALLQLKGGSFKSDVLSVISNAGMRSWFRDLFIESSDTQKLGGFDPYMNEYVLSSNENKLPAPVVCDNCGITKNIELVSGEDYVYCVDLDELVGDSTVTYTIPSGVKEYTIDVLYNGVLYSTGVVTSSGTLTFPKSLVNVSEATITISTNELEPDIIQVNVGCPEAQEMTIINVCITSNNNAGQYIHNQYRWEETGFVSPLHSNLVTFASGTSSPLVSEYYSLSGPQGAGIIPNDFATVTMFSNKIDFDDFVFDESSNKFKYLRTDTLYENNQPDISALLAASINITPIINTGAPDVYSAQFTMPSTGTYLYLITDYRDSTAVNLCYSAVLEDACCDCSFAPVPVPVPVPAPVPVVFNYYFLEKCEQQIDRVVRTTQTFTVSGNPANGTFVSIFGQGYYAKSGATQFEYDTNAGDEASYDLGSTAYPIIGCPQ